MKARHDPRREQKSPCHREKNELDVPIATIATSFSQNTIQRVSQNTTCQNRPRCAANGPRIVGSALAVSVLQPKTIPLHTCRMIRHNSRSNPHKSASVKGELQQKQILFAKRLFMAESSMHQAAKLAKFTEDHNIGRFPEVFAPIMAGICVVYARPFLRADGLGPLDEKYGRFDDAKLQDTHNDLIRNRHHFYAHRDFLKTRALDPTSGASRDMHSVHLFFDGQGSYTFATREPMYRDINLPEIIRIAEFQRQRIGTERHKVIDKLNRGQILPEGSYELGKDFPVRR